VTPVSTLTKCDLQSSLTLPSDTETETSAFTSETWRNEATRSFLCSPAGEAGRVFNGHLATAQESQCGRAGQGHPDHREPANNPEPDPEVDVIPCNLGFRKLTIKSERMFSGIRFLYLRL
jgi:hypothetical protein